MMAESFQERFNRWELEKLLLKHPGLRLIASGDGILRIGGEIHFHLIDDKGETLSDQYPIEIRVRADFPNSTPTVKETSERIPRDHHKLSNGCLCLGTPSELRLRTAYKPTLPSFVDDFVIPYLYGYTYLVRHGKLPFGERSHGTEGTREFIAEWFGSRIAEKAEDFLWLASMKKRRANKYHCPCSSGKKLGRCHNNRVNFLRDEMGRQWFQSEHDRFSNETRK